MRMRIGMGGSVGAGGGGEGTAMQRYFCCLFGEKCLEQSNGNDGGRFLVTRPRPSLTPTHFRQLPVFQEAA